MTDGGDGRFSGRVALVTGGSSGIGRAVALRLVADGARVVAVDRDAAGLRSLVARAPGGSVIPVTADVRDRASLETVRDRLRTEEVPIHILVPNAGINVRLPALQLSDSELHAILDTNLLGVILTCQVFGPQLLERSHGRVVVTSSIAAIQGFDLRAAYTATKAGLTGLVRSLAIEWGPKGCTVNAVGPGVIRTALLERYMEAHPERREAAIGHTPLGRLGEPEDVADVVAFLASDDARFINGQTIYVDGGLSAGHPWW